MPRISLRLASLSVALGDRIGKDARRNEKEGARTLAYPLQQQDPLLSSLRLASQPRSLCDRLHQHSAQLLDGCIHCLPLCREPGCFGPGRCCFGIVLLHLRKCKGGGLLSALPERGQS